MIGKKKVIGVCLTKINDICRADYINRLHFLGEENNCKMIVFNSFSDFYNGDAADDAAKSVYGIINYDIVDILVVMASSFHDKKVVEDIVSRAKECGKPVIIISGKAEGCWSINSECADNY